MFDHHKSFILSLVFITGTGVGIHPLWPLSKLLTILSTSLANKQTLCMLGNFSYFLSSANLLCMLGNISRFLSSAYLLCILGNFS